MNVTAQVGDTLFQASAYIPLDLRGLKRALRSALRQERKSISPSYRKRAARAIARHVLQSPAVRRARRVAVYLSMGSELATQPLIAALQAHQIEVFAPAFLRGTMRFRRLDSRHLQQHPLGMKQPRRGIALSAAAMDVVMLPLLGFDARGTRLGQGGGHYDRALAQGRFRPYRLGLAYAQQQVDLLPLEPFDQTLDAVLTERGLHRFPRRLNGVKPCATG